ncbi:MAG: CvpA family protein [Paludibacter sp.]|nr:CvpA family protein [Paludibacter sp.]
MNTLDFLILIPIGVGFISGLFKGLIKELTSLAAIFLGIFGAKLFAPNVSEMLIKSLKFSEKTATPIAYLILFIVIAVFLLVLANFLDKIFNSLSLGGLNKLMGGLFGALKYALIISVLLNVFNALDCRFSLINQDLKEQSIGYQPMMKLGPTLWEETKNAKAINREKEKTNEEKIEVY